MFFHTLLSCPSNSLPFFLNAASNLLFSDEEGDRESAATAGGGLDDGDKSSEKEIAQAGEEYDDLAAGQDSQFAGQYGGGSSQQRQGEHIFRGEFNKSV